MLSHALRVVAATSLVAAAAAGLGTLVVVLFPPRFSWFDRIACAWVGGLGLLGVILFVIGQVSFSISCLVFVTIAAVLPGLAGVLSWRRRSLFIGVSRPRVPAIPAAVIVFVLLLTAVGGLAEITGDWGNDAISYHLQGPKVWLREGIVRPLPDSSHTAFPAVGEILFGSEMALGGREAPGFSAVFTLTLFYLIVGSLALRSGLESSGAFWAVALVASMPAAYSGMHSGFVDGIYACFLLAAARVGLDAESTLDYAGFGLFCGLAMGAKYTGLMALPLLVFCTFFRRVSSDPGTSGDAARKGALSIVVACLVASPFYLRNWLQLGSPIYPPPLILSDYLAVKYLPHEAIQHFHEYIHQRGMGLGRGFFAYLLLPFNLTYHTSNFHGAGGIGLAPLAFGPFGLLTIRGNSFRKALAGLALLLGTAWFLTQQESRFLTPVYVIAAIFSVLGWKYAVQAAPRRTKMLAHAIITCSILYGIYMISLSQKDSVHSVFSSSFARQQAEERIPARESFEYLNREQGVRKVLILGRAVPPYYCDKEYLKPFGYYGEQVFPDLPLAADVLKHVHELGVSHILDVDTADSKFQVPDGFPGLVLVFEGRDQRVYRVE